jgi:hypothetical protein
MCVAVGCSLGYTQVTNAPASAEILAEVGAHGRALAEYDVASWHATDAVQALNPDKSKVHRYLARKTKDGWTVVFGKLSEDQGRFLIAYEATAKDAIGPFHTRAYRQPKEDSDFFLRAALATDAAIAAFGPVTRPYNGAALPAPEGRWWVYLVPAPTQAGVWPLGGDARYLISPDGKQILETRQLHKSILEYHSSDPAAGQIKAGHHTHVLREMPEDTDVFFVLTRQPRVLELILTEHFVYGVSTNGFVHYLMTTKEFFKDVPKSE